MIAFSDLDTINLLSVLVCNLNIYLNWKAPNKYDFRTQYFRNAAHHVPNNDRSRAHCGRQNRDK